MDIVDSIDRLMRDANAERRSKIRKSIVHSEMSWVGYIWDVIRNLIVLFVVIAIYDSIYDSDISLLFSAILLTYLSVLTIGAGIGMYSMNIGLINLESHLKTRKLILGIHGKINEEETDSLIDEEDEILKASYLAEKTQYKAYINMTFNFVLYVIAIFNILGNF